MSLHIFGNFVTPFGTAANNRGDNEGTNITPIQKLLWMGETHSTVSAEAIRFAVRRFLSGVETPNRTWDEVARNNTWNDWTFDGWNSSDGRTFIDDDLLGFMTAEAGKKDGSDESAEEQQEGRGKKKANKEKGKANVRRAVLEVTRAVSLTPWSGDITFNSAAPGATPSAQKKGNNPVPYGTEVHATRYQYGVALTPERLRDRSRAAKAIAALCNLGTVAGNHGRFLFDFSPDSVVIRLTDDPAPRMLYCFETTDDGRTVVAPSLLARINGGDIDAKELILGGSFAVDPAVAELKAKGATVYPNGIKAVAGEAMKRINVELGIKE